MKFSVDVSGWPRYLMPYRNIAENLNRLSRAHERYRRQTTDRQTYDKQTTDGRAIAYSERERELTFAKMMLRGRCGNWRTQASEPGIGASITLLVSLGNNPPLSG